MCDVERQSMFSDCYANMSEDWWAYMLLAFIVNLLLIDMMVSVVCFIIGLIIFELIVILIAFRFWDPIVRLGVFVAAILGIIVGLALRGRGIFDDEIRY